MSTVGSRKVFHLRVSKRTVIVVTLKLLPEIADRFDDDMLADFTNTMKAPLIDRMVYFESADKVKEKDLKTIRIVEGGTIKVAYHFELDDSRSAIVKRKEDCEKSGYNGFFTYKYSLVATLSPSAVNPLMLLEA
ncbi:hypothetical protein SARC_04156 [Sphaeroforma arctica JP610]|uniref:Uncharacterized protein n=1 Tax=Sphaeroforma arctica JP610 TaxID=667725 RepID=A0A0L0G3B9_9EUKA|nr:hypothetical protein, variant [Sphaeroforma arctica JP610]XP_014157500.1 hypothetical protein SARC_04156 [Sphaeroforma arctica JP610]KNC83597.1 hypothetical protein, variant [Sphaeroforma arctica JP610]KNC83598.1 hypothetical protein SARC_04156 [Sphaeroforma arctica JP610]|eukprot:XP_014157499.1 hypothetical protein, variant [Sphaeroforma arctica JP610]